MPKNLKTGWYVIYVKSCQERKVANLLQEKNLEAFVPLVKTIRQWSDRKKTILKPLFTSYVFVNINSSLEFYKALSVDGACAYIRFGEEYAQVTEEEIKKIKLLIGDENISNIETSNILPCIGEVKKIIYGPLTGLDCEILKVDNKNKIIVRLNSLKQNITATVSANFLDVHDRVIFN